MSDPRPGIRVSRLPLSEPTFGPASSSCDLEAHAGAARCRPSRRTPAPARGTLDPAQSRERLVQPGPLRVCRSPHGAPRATRSRRRGRTAPRTSVCSGTSACASAAPTNSRNSGAGRSGRDLNSGWYCEATKNGCRRRGSSIASTSRSSGDVPEQTSPARLEPPAQVVVDLVAMAVALVDDRLAVELAHPRRLVELDRVGAEPHRAAHVGDLLLLGQQVDHRERRLEVELGRVGAGHAGHVAGELAHRHLHAEADAEVRDLALARDLRGADLALDPATAEAPGDQDPVDAASSRASTSGSPTRSESTQSISTRQPWCTPE